MFCLHVCLFNTYVSGAWGSQEGIGSPGTVVRDGCKPRCGWQRVNLGSLQEQKVLNGWVIHLSSCCQILNISVTVVWWSPPLSRWAAQGTESINLPRVTLKCLVEPRLHTVERGSHTLCPLSLHGLSELISWVLPEFSCIFSFTACLRQWPKGLSY